jgi:hypothetical protein
MFFQVRIALLNKAKMNLPPMLLLLSQFGEIRLIEESANLERLIKRVDVLISILFDTSNLEHKGIPMNKRIEILNSCGLRPVEIADILGKRQTYVNKELTRIRKSKGDD